MADRIVHSSDAARVAQAGRLMIALLRDGLARITPRAKRLRQAAAVPRTEPVTVTSDEATGCTETEPRPWTCVRRLFPCWSLAWRPASAADVRYFSRRPPAVPTAGSSSVVAYSNAAFAAAKVRSRDDHKGSHLSHFVYTPPLLPVVGSVGSRDRGLQWVLFSGRSLSRCWRWRWG